MTTFANTICYRVPQSEQERVLYGMPSLFRPRKLDWMGKCIEWIKNPSHPLLLKIGITVGAVLGGLVLTLSVIGIPLLIYAFRECHQQDYDRVARQNFIRTQGPILNTRRRISERLGSLWLDAVPNLDLENRAGYTGHIDFLYPRHLDRHTVMKGFDLYGRPFIAFKLRNRETDDEFVVTYHQRFLDDDFWAWSGPVAPFDSNDCDPEDRLETVFHLIALDDHPKFKLSY